MTTYVAFSVDKDFRQDSDDLLEKLRARGRKPLTKDTVKIAHKFIEYMLQAYIYDFVDSVEVKPLTEKIIRQLGSLMQKTADTILDKVIKKLSNKDLLPLVDYFDEITFIKDDMDYIGIPLSESSAENFAHCFEKIDAGHGKEVMDKFAQEAENFADLSLEYYLVKPMSLLKTGPILRKIIDVATSTVIKAEKIAMKKVMGSLDEDEMREVATYLKKLLVEVD